MDSKIGTVLCANAITIIGCARFNLLHVCIVRVYMRHGKKTSLRHVFSKLTYTPSYTFCGELPVNSYSEARMGVIVTKISGCPVLCSMSNRRHVRLRALPDWRTFEEINVATLDTFWCITYTCRSPRARVVHCLEWHLFLSGSCRQQVPTLERGNTWNTKALARISLGTERQQWNVRNHADRSRKSHTPTLLM